MDRIGAASKVRQFNIMDNDFDVEFPSIYELEPEGNYKLDGYHLDEDFVPTLLRVTYRDIRERRPVYSGFLQIISLTQMVGDVLISLYLPTALQLPNTALINKLDNTIFKWQSGLISNIYNKSASMTKGNKRRNGGGRDYKKEKTCQVDIFTKSILIEIRYGYYNV